MHNNQMLSRIYGTAWLNDKDLKAYLHHAGGSREARPPQDRQGEMDLFHLQEEAPGLVFWHPRAGSIWQVVEQYMRRVYRETGYGKCAARRSSTCRCGRSPGHWDNYKDNMFFTESEKRTYAVKPMNCPATCRSSTRACTATATCRSATASSGPATATNPPGAARHPARARLHPGRRPHLLHRGPDRGR